MGRGTMGGSPDGWDEGATPVPVWGVSGAATVSGGVCSAATIGTSRVLHSAVEGFE